MNSKKHKNKNRAKVLMTAPQKIKNTEAENTVQDVQLVENLEKYLKLEEGKQNVALNVDHEIQVTGGNEQLKESYSEVISLNNEQTPVKPKRNKGKKNKRNNNEVSDFNDDSKKIEIVDCEEINLKETNLSDPVDQENVNVQASTRKKKNKDKKLHTFSHEYPIEDVSNTEVISLEENINDDVEEDQFIVQCANKKNKKKKRRLDSEKSEKADEKLSCTAAFNDLINVGDPGKGEEKDQETFGDNITACPKNPERELQTEDNIASELSKSEETVTKKKKKKEKKHPPKPEIGNQSDIHVPNDVNLDINTPDLKSIKTFEEDHQTNISSIENDTTKQCIITDEPKQKATIAKLVKKKTAGTSDKHQDKVKTVNNEKSFCVSSDSDKSQEIKIENEEDPLQLLKPEKSSQNIKLPDTVFQSPEDMKCFDEKLGKVECFQTSKNTAKLKNDDFVPLLENIELNLRTVNDELDSKILPNIEIDKISENIKNDSVKLLDETSSKNMKLNEDATISETKNISDNIPDFIQIPRSSSQHLFADNNNNTVIHEITPNDEIKLGVPVLTSNIIQGSGETPVSTPKITSDDISFTEIESIPDKVQEKSDLKSKMLKVNQDLEELNKSLEKSLTELATAENSEEKLEKEKSSIAYVDTERIDKINEDKTLDEIIIYKPLADRLNDIENKYISLEENQSSNTDNTLKQESNIDDVLDIAQVSMTPPICPSRKDRKGKGKSKKRGRREPELSASQTEATSTDAKSNESNNENKDKEKSKTSEEKGKQKSADGHREQNSTEHDFEPIENFEDALTSSVDDADVNKTFEIIANELNSDSQMDQVQKELKFNKPEINITPPTEDIDKEKQRKNSHPVSQPKNLLGHCNTPVPSNKIDYKKEKNRTPNTKQAKVKIKDAVEPESGAASTKTSKQSQTENKIKFTNNKNENESFSYVTNEKEEYVYKYSFRKVYLASVCHVCRKELKPARIACKFCNLLFYCSQKHKDEDWPRHQSLCFAVSTIVHLKDQKHIYSDAKNLSGQNYRLIRMQMILSCEKVLNRKLLAWEQEALLYPRICADIQCREWKQSKLRDCDGCGQVSYCTDNPHHLPASHQRWCKSYALYQKLVLYQELNGRLEPKQPGKVIADEFVLPGKINEVLASMYNEKIDMTDIQYAALTQLATEPLTTAYSYQTFRQLINCSNGFTKKSTFTIHVVGADLQFDADSLNKWEVFLLHLKPNVQVLRVELVGQKLNPSNLPLHLLGKINLCAHCRENNRRVQISFQDKSYNEYWSGDDFIVPDIVCAFNPSIQRSLAYSGGDCWVAAINCILRQKVPFLITSHTLEELKRDLDNIRDCVDVNYKVVAEPKHNPFASFRPDRNFITDEETPLLFKNYSFSILCGV